MKTSNREQIEIAYLNAHAKVLELVEQLRERIENLPAPGNDDVRLDYGHVGSLSHVADLMQEVIESV